MSTPKSSSGRDLIRTVAGDQLSDMVFDLAEVALDENLAEGVLKDLPVVGSIVKLARVGENLRSELFLRKLLQFLQEIKSIPEKERKKLLTQYPDDSPRQQNLGENLLLALERLDNMEKPQILAKFFSAYVRSEIDFTLFSRLSLALERLNLALLPNITKFYIPSSPSADLSEEIIHELSLSGLIAGSLLGSGSIGGSAMYVQTALGRDFLRIGFGLTPTP